MTKMEYTPVTPFRRTIDAAILKHQAATQEDLPPAGANKWEVLRELAAARVAFGLSDRDLTVLQALVSFHQATILGGNDSELIVHPSNKAICERLNGMPCSTMRRHLSNLVQTGFVVRRDSPNGKRYARRYGDEKVAFGFDLSPLVRRFQEVCEAAETVRAAEERYKRLRATVSLMRRDLAGLAEYGRSLRPDQGVWDQFSDLAALMARDLRRKLEMEDLRRIEDALGSALDHARSLLDGCETLQTQQFDFRVVGREAPGGAFEAFAIELAEGEFATLYDLGSTNGTSVNGRTIKQVGIREGDLIQLGTSVTLRFGLRSRHELGGTAPLPAPIPAPVPPPAASDLQLSRRELEVARLASTGLNNDEIAKRLFISPKTVKTHLRNIYQRLDLHSKVELTRYLLQHGALEPHDDE